MIRTTSCLPFEAQCSPEVLALANQRGIATHKAAQIYALNKFFGGRPLNMDTVHEDVLPYYKGFEKFMLETGFIPTHVEQEVVNEAYGYAGRIDFIGMLQERYTFLELKTGPPSKMQKLYADCEECEGAGEINVACPECNNQHESNCNLCEGIGEGLLQICISCDGDGKGKVLEEIGHPDTWGVQLEAYLRAWCEQTGEKTAKYQRIAVQLTREENYRIHTYNSKGDFSIFLAYLTIKKWRDSQ